MDVVVVSSQVRSTGKPSTTVVVGADNSFLADSSKLRLRRRIRSWYHINMSGMKRWNISWTFSRFGNATMIRILWNVFFLNRRDRVWVSLRERRIHCLGNKLKFWFLEIFRNRLLWQKIARPAVYWVPGRERVAIRCAGKQKSRCKIRQTIRGCKF